MQCTRAQLPFIPYDFWTCLDFKTPEEYFLGEAPAPFQWGSVDPDKVLSDPPKSTPKKQEYHAKVGVTSLQGLIMIWKYIYLKTGLLTF